MLAKVVRGFERDLEDARQFVQSGMVDTQKLRELVAKVPDSSYSKYPNLAPQAVVQAVAQFLTEFE